MLSLLWNFTSQVTLLQAKLINTSKHSLLSQAIYFVLTFTVTRILRYVERRLDQDTYTQGGFTND